MKKSMIAAGAASLALAAMPVVGVFADVSQVVDTLQLTVNAVCNLAETPTGGANTYTASAGTDAKANFTASTDTTFTVNCNTGYTITPTFTSLTSSASGAQAITYGTYNSTDVTAGTWAAGYKIGTAASFTGMTNNTAINGTANDGAVFTFDYIAHTATDQVQGTYTGTATYALATN